MQDIIIIYGPIIAAIITGVFTIFTPFIGKSNNTKWQTYFKFTFATLAIISLVLGMFIFREYWQPKDQWSLWSLNVEKDIKKCTKKENSVVFCVKQSLNDNQKKLPSLHNIKDTARVFYHDIRAGSSLMNISEVKDVFYKKFGIKDNTFLGSGSTVPWSHTPEYKNADAREYLIPNLHESNPFVWTWQLNRLNTDLKNWTVRKLIKKKKSTKESSQTSLKKYFKRLDRKRTSITSEPPVIRFQEFSKKYYKGTLGRPESYRVFSVSLQDVWDMTLEDAIRASGFIWDPSNSYANDKTLFIWLFVPSHDKEVIPATWGNLLKYAPNWLEEGLARQKIKSSSR